eukprot:NODE_138_length_3083_cov_46.150297_g128_i0.p1 GENE.NODE_138_length_3083_cov_46.150297_g128_i0~~NODE_138_length_3083_cov_46.150297_g128_i0.p1  ORF type:complete len:992 (-),score=226.34 NODE_138_length_3083_cov_46.150297_g128_i0:78-3053(-)
MGSFVGSSSSPLADVASPSLVVYRQAVQVYEGVDPRDITIEQLRAQLASALNMLQALQKKEAGQSESLRQELSLHYTGMVQELRVELLRLREELAKADADREEWTQQRDEYANALQDLQDQADQLRAEMDHAYELVSELNQERLLATRRAEEAEERLAGGHHVPRSSSSPVEECPRCQRLESEMMRLSDELRAEEERCLELSSALERLHVENAETATRFTKAEFECEGQMRQIEELADTLQASEFARRELQEDVERLEQSLRHTEAQADADRDRWFLERQALMEEVIHVAEHPSAMLHHSQEPRSSTRVQVGTQTGGETRNEVASLRDQLRVVTEERDILLSRSLAHTRPDATSPLPPHQPSRSMSECSADRDTEILELRRRLSDARQARARATAEVQRLQRLVSDGELERETLREQFQMENNRLLRLIDEVEMERDSITKQWEIRKAAAQQQEAKGRREPKRSPEKPTRAPLSTVAECQTDSSDRGDGCLGEKQLPSPVPRDDIIERQRMEIMLLRAEVSSGHVYLEQSVAREAVTKDAFAQATKEIDKLCAANDQLQLEMESLRLSREGSDACATRLLNERGNLSSELQQLREMVAQRAEGLARSQYLLKEVEADSKSWQNSLEVLSSLVSALQDALHLLAVRHIELSEMIETNSMGNAGSPGSHRIQVPMARPQVPPLRIPPHEGEVHWQRAPSTASDSATDFSSSRLASSDSSEGESSPSRRKPAERNANNLLSPDTVATPAAQHHKELLVAMDAADRSRRQVDVHASSVQSQVQSLQDALRQHEDRLQSMRNLLQVTGDTGCVRASTPSPLSSPTIADMELLREEAAKWRQRTIDLQREVEIVSRERSELLGLWTELQGVITGKSSVEPSHPKNDRLHVAGAAGRLSAAVDVPEKGNSCDQMGAGTMAQRDSVQRVMASVASDLQRAQGCLKVFRQSEAHRCAAARARSSPKAKDGLQAVAEAAIIIAQALEGCDRAAQQPKRMQA